MIDYVAMANKRMTRNLGRGADLVGDLVGAYVESGQDVIRIVASGSSHNSSECARAFMQAVLDVPVTLVTPGALVGFEGELPTRSFDVVVSQSGYSTNVLDALDFLHERGIPTLCVTGDVGSPASRHADRVFNYGVGVESVDFVTMGVETLVLYLMLFSLYAAEARGTLGSEGLRSRLDGLGEAVKAQGAALSIAREFVSSQERSLSRIAPAVILGSGPNVGVAREGALKFMEAMKLPCTPFEAEEFMHGPEMQLTPSHLIFVIDDPAGSERLAQIFAICRRVTSSAYFMTSHGTGVTGEIPMPALPDPLTAAIPNLVIFQTVAAMIADRQDRWDVNPLLAWSETTFGTKASGYGEHVKILEAQARRQYGDQPRQA